MLVTDLVNVRYLSGFTGSNAALLVLAEHETPVLATDGRYRIQAAQQSPDAEVVIERACGPHLAARAAAWNVRRLGFESHVVTVDGHSILKKAAGETQLVRAAGYADVRTVLFDVEVTFADVSASVALVGAPEAATT